MDQETADASELTKEQLLPEENTADGEANGEENEFNTEELQGELEGEDNGEQEQDGTTGDAIDTTAEFLKIFQGKTEFNSWEEFHTLFEQFQRETGSAFKPKSATSIEYANERRVRDTIPDHFVYQTVKMVCTRYGIPTPIRREGSASKPRKYVGLGCEAMVHLRYKGGTLNIVACNLEHKNHPLHAGTEPVRSIRSFCFSDDVDHLIAKVVMEHNPFAHWNSEKEWMALVADLQSRDTRMRTVTVRVVKKRIRFLIDRYTANSDGKAPLPDDEMGIILYELAKAKQDALDSIARAAKTPGRKRGRPRKYPRPDSDEDETADRLFGLDDSETFLPERKPVLSGPPPIKDVPVFLRYMERRDDNDRRIKQDDIDLRKGELELRRKELEIERERFEFDRLERQAHLDLLKTQLEMVAASRVQHQHHHHHQQQPTVQTQPQQNHQKLVVADPKGDGSGVTEYTIVLNNDQQFATQ